MIATAALVFAATACTDLFWTLYVTNAAAGNKWSASAAAGFIILTGSITTVEFVQNRWMVLPAALGAFVGTLVPMMVKERRVGGI